MSIRRRTYGSWTPESSAKAHAAKARKRMEGAPRQPDPPKPLLRRVLQWTGVDGAVHRWVIRPGKRRNGIAVCAKGKTVQCGYDRLLRSIRKHILTSP